MEVTLLKMIEARNAVSIDTVFKQVQQLRTRLRAAGRNPRAFLRRRLKLPRRQSQRRPLLATVRRAPTARMAAADLIRVVEPVG